MQRFCLIMILFAMCLSLTSCFSDASVVDSEKADVYYSGEEVTVGLVKIGVDDNFTLWLDMVSDVLYLEYKNVYAGGLTVMMDPDIPGTPLTYQRYVELWNAKKDIYTTG